MTVEWLEEDAPALAIKLSVREARALRTLLGAMSQCDSERFLKADHRMPYRFDEAALKHATAFLSALFDTLDKRVVGRSA